MTRILALDQASRVSGWSIFIDGKLEDWGHLETLQDDLGVRLLKIREFIIDKVNEWDIDTIAFEDIQLQSSAGNNVSTHKILAAVFGVVLETATELDKEHIVVHSQVWKSSLQIKGRTRADQKKSAKEYVINTYGIKPTQDEADSICIGTYVCKNEVGHDWSK